MKKLIIAVVATVFAANLAFAEEAKKPADASTPGQEAGQPTSDRTPEKETETPQGQTTTKDGETSDRTPTKGDDPK